MRSTPSPHALALALALAPALALAGCAGATAQTTRRPDFHAAGHSLAHPPRDSIRNANGSPRVLSDSAYRLFWSDIAPKLEEWAHDPRLDVNPAFVAGLLAKESGFEAGAASPAGAYGIAQLTPAGDTDLRTRAGTPTFAWMLPEILGWPRDTALRAGGAPALAEGRALAEEPPGEAARRDYLFDPVLETRAAVFWLRMLEVIWTTDVWPGAYGSFAREKLNGSAGGAPLTELQLLDLAAVSYNQGVEYARDLVTRFGPAWTGHLDPEPSDYLERVRAYTVLFEK